MDYKNCKCINSIVDKLLEGCTKVVNENKIYNETLNKISSNDSLSDCVSCTPYLLLFAVFLVTSVIIGRAFVYFYGYSKKDNVQRYFKKDNVRIKFNLITQKKIIACNSVKHINENS